MFKVDHAQVPSSVLAFFGFSSTEPFILGTMEIRLLLSIHIPLRGIIFCLSRHAIISPVQRRRYVIRTQKTAIILFPPSRYLHLQLHQGVALSRLPHAAPH